MEQAHSGWSSSAGQKDGADLGFQAHYNQSEWPEAELISSLVQNGANLSQLVPDWSR